MHKAPPKPPETAKHKPSPRDLPPDELEELPLPPPPRRREDEPRPRPRRYEDDRYDDYDDDDYFDDGPQRRRNPFGAAKIGLLLLSISMWLYVATFGFLVLVAILAWSESVSAINLIKIPGLLGLLNWIVGLVGIGFCIAGPTKYGARGLAIAATIVSVVQLVFMALVAGRTGGIYSGLQGSSYGRDSFTIAAFSTMWVAVDAFLVVMVYASKIFGEFVLPMIAGLCELARLILILLVARSISKAAKNRSAANSSLTSVYIVSITATVIPIILVLIAIILQSSSSSGRPAFSSSRSAMDTVGAIFMLILLAHTGALVMPGIAMQSARAAAARMTRRR